MFINTHIASDSLDPFFIIYSQIFEGWAIIFVVFAFAFISKQKMVCFAIAAILSSVLIYVLKDYVIGNIPRPTKLLPLETYVHILKDRTIYKENYTFPSGHTAFAFAIMGLAAIITKNRLYTILYFFIALGCAFSRLYLLQHFFIDIYCGAILGYLIALFVYSLFTTVLAIKDEPLIRIKRH